MEWICDIRRVNSCEAHLRVLSDAIGNNKWTAWFGGRGDQVVISIPRNFKLSRRREKVLLRDGFGYTPIIIFEDGRKFEPSMSELYSNNFPTVTQEDLDRFYK